MPGPTSRTIAIAGSSGFIGSALVRTLEARGCSVRRLVRRAPRAPSEIAWNPARGELASGALDGAEVVINLAGENLFQRWSGAAKQRIRDSRVQATTLLARAMAADRTTARVLLNASAIGIYGNRGDEILDESSPHGGDFLASVCEQWEAATQPARDVGVRVAHLRTGIVLDHEGGALKKMLPFFWRGLGGPLGSGAQWMSWISLTDEVRAIEFLMDDARAAGPFNLVAPSPVTNSEFSHTLGEIVRKPAALRVPKLALTLLMGEMAEQTALASQRVLPSRLDALGFRCEHPQLRSALRAAIA
jgi:uncharacterized protein (TIGR01777 family)